MATLVNRYYTGEYDPNLASGIETKRPEVKLGKQVYHEHPATKVNWQYPWPYTQMIMAQGGKAKPEQFLGRLRPSDNFVKSMLKQQAEEKQRKIIEERMIDIKSNAEMDRLVKEYAMGQFKNQMNTRDLEYQYRLLGDDAAFASERERLRAEIGTRQKYAGLGALTNPQATRYFANQEMYREAVPGARGDPLPNPGMNALDAVLEENDVCRLRDTTQPMRPTPIPFPNMDTPLLSSGDTTMRYTPDETDTRTPAQMELDAQINVFMELERSRKKHQEIAERVFKDMEESTKDVDDSVGVLENTNERMRETFDRSPAANTSDQVGEEKAPRLTEQLTETNPDEGPSGEGSSPLKGTYFDSSITEPEYSTTKADAFRNYSSKSQKGFITFGSNQHKAMWRKHMSSGRPSTDFAWLPDPNQRRM
jgi:hypothetical protein